MRLETRYSADGDNAAGADLPRRRPRRPARPGPRPTTSGPPESPTGPRSGPAPPPTTAPGTTLRRRGAPGPGRLGRRRADAATSADPRPSSAGCRRRRRCSPTRRRAAASGRRPRRCPTASSSSRCRAATVRPRGRQPGPAGAGRRPAAGGRPDGADPDRGRRRHPRPGDGSGWSTPTRPRRSACWSNVPLAQPGATVDRVFAFGVRASLDPGDGAAELSALLDAHRYATGAALRRAGHADQQHRDRPDRLDRAPRSGAAADDRARGRDAGTDGDGARPGPRRRPGHADELDRCAAGPPARWRRRPTPRCGRPVGARSSSGCWRRAPAPLPSRTTTREAWRDWWQGLRPRRRSVAAAAAG